MNFVAIDLGASGSRYVSDSGQISVVPNNMVMMDTNEVSNITVEGNEIENCLEVKIEQLSRTSTEATEVNPFPANILVGIMAEKDRRIDDRPNMLTHKHLQSINYVSAILCCALSKIKYGLDNNINLYLAMPPYEIINAQKAFSNVLVGSYRVTFPKYMGGTTVEFNINSVDCYEEALMASTSFFFNMNGTQKEANKHLLSGSILSLDIGASTTDFAIIKGGRYMDNSGFSIKVGGNVALGAVRTAIRNKYGFEIPFADAEKVMVEGRVQLGNHYEDASDIVSKAKQELAKEISTYFGDYFKNCRIPIQSLNAVMVSGGGSMQSQYVNGDGEVVKTSEPMSTYVTNELKDICKYVEAISYGDEPRFANVKGLFVRAKIDSVIKAQKAAQAVAPAQAQAVAPAPKIDEPAVAPAVAPATDEPAVAPAVAPSAN